MSNSPWSSQIIRVSTGFLNTVNDTVIAGVPSFPGGSVSKFAGQLGKHLTVGNDQIEGMYDSTVGTLYAGRYRYVRRRSTDDDSPAVAPGKIAFWDTTVTNWQNAFQVTTDENLSSSQNAVMRAGIFIGNIEPGNYGFIQDLGEVFVRFRSVLTTSGVTGSPVYAAGAGDLGNDQGTCDTITTDSTAIQNEKFMGWAVVAPTNGGLKQILLASTAFAQIF